MAEHSLLSSKITLLLGELITRYHYVTFFFSCSHYFYQIGWIAFSFFYNDIECKQIDVSKYSRFEECNEYSTIKESMYASKESNKCEIKILLQILNVELLETAI